MVILSVIIVDDHEIFRKGLKTVLNDIDFVKVVAEASNGQELLKLLKNVECDIIFMDISMPQMDGIEATRKVKELHPNIEIIALTMHENIGYFNKMIEAGAKGFLLKNTNKNEIIEALQSVANGQNYYSQEFCAFFNIKQPTRKLNIDITDREKEILELICKGYSSIEIADKLGISQRTVEGHKAHLFEKTGTKNTASLVVFAIKNGLIKI